MFGICMLHSVSQGSASDVGSKICASMLLACVSGFVFISGWFGIRFKLSKLFGVYGVGAFSAFITTCLFYYHNPVVCGGLFWRFGYTFKDYWFLNAYALLMLMSPLLNLALRSIRNKEGFAAVSLAVICVVGWSFVSQLPVLRSWLPTSAGLQNYSGFMFMGIYLIAGVWREFDFARHVGCGVFCCLIAITAIYPLSLGAYSSPFSIAVAGMAFCLCKRLVLPAWGERICSFISPSLFSIYLIHTNQFGFEILCRLRTYLAEDYCPYPLACFITGVVVFAICLAIDMIRRILVFPCQGLIKRLTNVTDEFFDLCLEKLFRKIVND